MMQYEKTKIADMGRLTEEQFHRAAKRPVIAVLDNVRSQYNVGAVFRTADAFLIEAVYLCGISPTPENVEVHKTALGAEKTVASRQFENTTDAVEALHAMGYKVFAIEQCHNSQTLEEVVATLRGEDSEDCLSQKIAVIFGHEVFGVAQEVIDMCDGCIEIPQYGTKHSLNVSTTAGIVLYELTKE